MAVKTRAFTDLPITGERKKSAKNRLTRHRHFRDDVMKLK
jgi:hypothetical protein